MSPRVWGCTGFKGIISSSYNIVPTRVGVYHLMRPPDVHSFHCPHLGTKFTRLEIKEIKEKSDVKSTDLIVVVIKIMIKNKEIYGEYFSSSRSIAFDQSANSKVR